MPGAKLDFNCTKQELDETVCKNGLLQYNIEATNGLLLEPSITDIKIVVREDNGDVVGGILCDTFNRCLYIDVLWVAGSHRGQGWGYRLITEAERIAREAGCTFAHTCTFSYQSPDFYQRQGYEVFGRLDDYPEGIIQFFLKKKL